MNYLKKLVKSLIIATMAFTLFTIPVMAQEIVEPIRSETELFASPYNYGPYVIGRGGATITISLPSNASSVTIYMPRENNTRLLQGTLTMGFSSQSFTNMYNENITINESQLPAAARTVRITAYSIGQQDAQLYYYFNY